MNLYSVQPGMCAPAWLTLTLVVLMGVTGCANRVNADQAPLNCAIPRVDNPIAGCAVVKMASEFSDCLGETDINEHTCVIMDRNLSFCPNQPSLPITAIFKQSDRTLDCAGGSIDHGWGRTKRPGGPATSQQGRKPAIRFLEDKSLSGITVSNCTLRGTNHMGIQATRFLGGQLGEEGVLDDSKPLPVGHNNLVFKNLKIEDTITGIYLGAFSESVSIENVHIDNTQRIAVYFEAGSHKVRIVDSIISNNQSREAVAIDSSYNNEVSNTLFLNNREGGINLYQNCGEIKGIVCPITRPTPPNNNRISNNHFINTGKSGVHIASRQGRKHAWGWCASLRGLPGKFTDTSQDNVVSNNTFVCTEGTSLIVKDGPNEVIDNHIVAQDECVPFEISTGGYRRFNNKLLHGLTFRGNSIQSEKDPVVRNFKLPVDSD